MAKKLTNYSVVDAFTESPFKGNPAAVCFLDEDRDDQWLLSVAAEFNTPVTCYLSRIVESESHDPSIGSSTSTFPRFRLRWFTPLVEIEICGHATLAAAHTLFASGKIDSDVIEFVSRLFGILTAKRVPENNNNASDGSNIQNGEVQKGFLIELNFPADPNTEINSAEETLISKALGGASVVKIRKTTNLDNLIVVLPSAKSVAELKPDFGAIKKCRGWGMAVTGIAPPESGFDFHSRFFAPKVGVNEDHVCGSAHCGLAPLWSKELGKCDFVANQASPRGGVLNIHLDEQNQRVLLRGKACTVMEGTLLV